MHIEAVQNVTVEDVFALDAQILTLPESPSKDMLKAARDSLAQDLENLIAARERMNNDETTVSRKLEALDQFAKALHLMNETRAVDQ